MQRDCILSIYLELCIGIRNDMNQKISDQAIPDAGLVMDWDNLKVGL
jgi:hypothetical protein